MVDIPNVLECETTTDPEQAIFQLIDGTLIFGDFDCGVRGLDHNVLASAFGKDIRALQAEFGIIRLVPETMVALYVEGQPMPAVRLEVYDYEAY